MRSSMVPVVGLLVALISQPVMAGDTLPERKAGLWELKTSMNEGQGEKEMSMKMCIDGEMEKNTVAASISEHKSNCSFYEIKVSDGKTIVEADCIFNRRKVLSTTNMSGDFKNEFEIDIDSTTSNPEAKEQTVVVKRSIKQHGKYLGESCGELKGGEAQAGDGTKILVQ